jgi:hypothetical protein
MLACDPLPENVLDAFGFDLFMGDAGIKRPDYDPLMQIIQLLAVQRHPLR